MREEIVSRPMARCDIEADGFEPCFPSLESAHEDGVYPEELCEPCRGTMLSALTTKEVSDA